MIINLVTVQNRMSIVYGNYTFKILDYTIDI